jgi:hypothetical protein
MLLLLLLLVNVFIALQPLTCAGVGYQAKTHWQQQEGAVDLAACRSGSSSSGA